MPALSALLPRAPDNVVPRSQLLFDGRPAAGPKGFDQFPDGLVFFPRPHAPAEAMKSGVQQSETIWSDYREVCISLLTKGWVTLCVAMWQGSRLCSGNISSLFQLYLEANGKCAYTVSISIRGSSPVGIYSCQCGEGAQQVDHHVDAYSLFTYSLSFNVFSRASLDRITENAHAVEAHRR